MKKSLFFAVAATVLSGCASDELVDVSVPNTGTSHSDIRFTISQKNTTRGYSDLNKTGHYNFGVFAYKSTDMVNSVMPNYLVGYYDEANGYQQAGTTVGDSEGLVDGLSYWMYEGMGSAEYNGTYAGGALTNAFKSNNANQYLKYWDSSAETTAFYAYAPYINKNVKSPVTYVDGTPQSATGNDTYVMCFPDGTIEAGMDNPSLSEYMYAYHKVPKASYGHDVSLQFTRLNAKVNIKFWEDVPGYKVRILDLSSSHAGVQAAASIKEAGQGDFGYRGGKFYKKNGVKISFASTPETIKQFVGTTQTNSEPLVFAAPTDAQIGENRYEASASASTYYAIPKGQGSNLLASTSTDFSNAGAAEDTDFGLTGFTFHVSYELTAEDTGEKIVVSNATVHVPCDYANWKPNTHYTYIFKITKDSNGTTEDPDQPGGPTVDPTDPEVPETQALYPIIFDNCTVVDWDEIEGEWNISDDSDVIYHDIKLDTYSIDNDGGVITITDITNNDTYKDAEIDWTAITVTGPAPATTDVTSWYDNSTHKITVPATAASGVYTITYTCPATYDQTTHPSTWTETFFVGNAYTLALNQYEAGTNSLADSKLTITTEMDGSASTPTVDQLYIDYPANFTAAQKAGVSVDLTNMQVVVKNNATPGVYEIVYKIKEGDKSVDVAKKTFTVKDYKFALSHSVVFLGASPVVVNAIVPEASGEISMTTTTGITVDNSAKTISVANTTAETETGYTVTYTLFKGTVSEVKYEQSFKVRNTHSVTVDKTAIDRNEGTSNVGDYTTDNIVVTTLHNGVATTEDLATANKLAVVKLAANGAETATTSGDFTITQTATDANTYNLKVKNNVATGDYYVKYVSTVGGVDKAEYVHFVVTE